eukprot:TRINITY_DN2784_c0_g1_i3.p1 TRINITY_DN2784_c0_g1~~TRINITY_DN2784_c0_g1_i3.p1  ORF type:complete len:287 (-),score=60.92 TRINITY_DN2784_c0_g1_i3:100-900(-)
MGKVAAVASLGFVTCGTWQLSKAFVPAAHGVGAKDARSALRGAAAVESKADASSSSADPALISVGVLSASAALAAAMMAQGSRRGRVARKAVAAAAPLAEDEVPPPPPPFDPSTQVGVTAPLGFFDPVGFAKKGDEAGFRKLRSAEIKHGRVAMMGALGAVVQHYVQIPGFEKIPKGLGAVTSDVGSIGMIALVLVSGVFELVLWKDDDGKAPGDYGNPVSFGVPLGWNDDMRNRELNNGRAAMFSVLGIIVAELATGKDAVQQFS